MTNELKIEVDTSEVEDALEKTRELTETIEDLNEAQSRIIIRNNEHCEINIYASNNRLDGLEGIENADR